MELFQEIRGAVAVLRVPNGVHKQTKVFHRGERVFVPHGGGFVRMTCSFGEVWGTSHPKVSVVDISQDIPGLFVVKEPRYKAA